MRYSHRLLLILFIFFLSINFSNSKETAFVDIDFIIANSNIGKKVLLRIDKLDKENLEIVEELAATLNAAIGGTRAVVAAGWMPYSQQVGQTGKTVKPDVYIACGISGATQHQVGMKDSKFIIAINKDEEAPIFQLADWGIVGDTLSVIPKINQNL